MEKNCAAAGDFIPGLRLCGNGQCFWAFSVQIHSKMLTLSDHNYSLQNWFAANAKPLLFSTQKCACMQPKLAQTRLVDVTRAISGLQTETRRPETSGLPIRFCIFTGITLYTDVSAITSVYLPHLHIKKQHLSLKILLLLLKVIIII